MRKRNGLLETITAGIVALAPTIGCIEQYSPMNLPAPETTQTQIEQEINPSQEEPKFHWVMNELTQNTPSDTLIITTSDLPRNENLQNAITNYIETVGDVGLKANYIELDSEQTLTQFGLNVNQKSIDNFTHTINQIVEDTDAKYVIFLGGEKEIPRPSKFLSYDGTARYVPSDMWYFDQDDNNVIDEGISVGRMTYFSNDAREITSALQTSTKIHSQGGLEILTMAGAGGFAGNSSPPYGICDTCTEQEQFITDFSGAEYLRFAGHGSPQGIYQGYGEFEHNPIINTLTVSHLNLSDTNPLVTAFGPCNTGRLADYNTFATGLLENGATAFIGRTTTQGYPVIFQEEFERGLKEGLPIGETLTNAIQYSVENGLPNLKGLGELSHQYQLYGDPSIIVLDATQDL